MSLPVIFLCENNGWPNSPPARSREDRKPRDRAIAYGMPGVIVKNDVAEIYEVCGEAV